MKTMYHFFFCSSSPLRLFQHFSFLSEFKRENDYFNATLKKSIIFYVQNSADYFSTCNAFQIKTTVIRNTTEKKTVWAFFSPISPLVKCLVKSVTLQEYNSKSYNTKKKNEKVIAILEAISD